MRLLDRLPRDFIDLLERSRLDIARGEVENLSHTVEWSRAEAWRFPQQFSRRGILKLGLIVPTAAGLFWPRPAYAIGFTRPYLTPALITGPTSVAPAPTGVAATDRTNVLNAINAIPAAGGTLILQAGTYVIGSPGITITGKTKFRVTGPAGAIISAGSANDVLHFTNCDDFVLDGFTVDGRNDTFGNTGNSNLVFQNCKRFSVIGVLSRRAGFDGFRSTATQVGGNNPLGPTSTWCQDGLFYDCVADAAIRLGMSVINAINIQVLGGEYKNTNGANPNGGIDLEPNHASATDAIDQVLMRGITCSGNRRRDIQLSNVGAPQAYTIEGCLLKGTTTLVDGAAAIIANAGHVLIQANAIEDFAAGVDRGLIDCSGDEGSITITDNSFNRCAHSGLINGAGIFAHSSAGPNIAATNNRFFQVTGGPTVTLNSPSSSQSGNTTVGAATQPANVPPVASFIGQDCFP